MANKEELGLEVAVEGFRAFMSNMAQMDQAINKSSGSWTNLSGVAGGAAGILGGVVKTALTGVAIAATAITTALVGVIASSTQVAADFQMQMAILEVSARGAGTSFEDLHDAALAVGADTSLVGVSASSAADSMTGLYKAGLTTTEIFGDLQGYLSGTAELGGALRASIDLAAASELDMVQASELAAVVLSTFGGELETEAERAEFITDALNNFAQTADASVADVMDLADALKNIGPTAAAFGFSLEDTNVALAILASRGIRGAEAGTALKSMMTNLMRQTDDVTATLASLNVELYNTDGTMRELPDIIGQLQEGMAGLTEEQRNQAVQTLAGTYGMNAMNALLGEGVEGWNEMTTAVGEAATIQEQAAARTNTLQGAWEAFKGVVETLQIQIGEKFLPIFQGVVNQFSEFITNHGPQITAVFDTIATTLATVVGVVGEFVANLLSGQGPVEAFVGAIEGAVSPETVSFFENLFNQVNTVVTFILDNQEAFIGALTGIAVAFGALTVISTIAGLLAIITNPLTLIIALAGLLGVAWSQNWGGIQEKTQAVIDFIQPYITNALTAIQNFWAMHGQTIINTVTTFITAVQTTIQTVLAVIQAWWALHGDSVMSIVSTFVTAVQTTITSIITNISQFIETILAGIQKFWDAHGDTITKAAGRAWETIKIIINTVLENISTLIDAVSKAIQGDWKGFGESLREATDRAWEAIKEIIHTTLENAKDLIGDAIETIKKKFNDVDWGKLGRSVIDGIVNGILAGVGAVADAIGSVADAAAEAWDGFWDSSSPSKLAEKLAQTVPAGFVKGIMGGVREVVGAMQGLATSGLGALSGIANPATAGVLGNTMATSSPVARPGGNTISRSSSYTNSPEYHLHTNTTLGQGQLATEFKYMEMASR